MNENLNNTITNRKPRQSNNPVLANTWRQWKGKTPFDNLQQIQARGGAANCHS